MKRKNIILDKYRVEYGLTKAIACPPEENEEYRKLKEEGKSLPEGIEEYTDMPGDFYRLHEEEITDAERKEYLAYKKLDVLRSIKNCFKFFVVLTVVSIVCSLVSLIGTCSIMA